MLLAPIKRFVFFALQMLMFQFAMAGTVQDSLLQLIDNAKGEKEQAMLYCSLAKSLQYISADSAVNFAQKGFELSQVAEYELGMAEASAALGDIYVITNQLEEAKKYYSSAADFFKVIGHLFDVTQINMILGNIHLAQNEYLPALRLYQESLDNSLENDFSSLTPHLYNNIGELYLEIEDIEAAKANFEHAYNLFEQQKDQYNLAICMLNLARISTTNNNREEAIKGYLDAIRILSTMRSWHNIASAYNSIADLYIVDGDYGNANEYLNLALNIIENNNSTFDGPSSIFSTKIFTNVAKLALERRDKTRALNFAKRSLKLSKHNLYKASILDNSKLLSRIYEDEGKADSALVYYRTALEYTEQIQKEDNIKKITQLRMQYEFDAMLQQKELEDVKRSATHRQREMLYIGILGVIIFSISLLMLLYGNQKTKADRAILQKENLELEKTKLNQALTYKNKELATNMMYLLEKNEFITAIARKLSEAKDAFNRSNQSVVQRIINELKQNSSKGIWEEFEMRFKEVHADFYTALTEKFPYLTPNEIRICAFLRLNMSTKEISAITHQSVKSIDMARFRLRKKMDIDRDENLIIFLAQL